MAKKKTNKKTVKKAEQQGPVVFGPGDTVKVHVKIPEEDGKVRIQTYEGLVIAMRGSGISKTFTVRRVSYGEGVERVFPLQSPMLERIEVLRKGRVRRAKLYYLRGKKGKKTRIEEKREPAVNEVSAEAQG